MKNKNIGLRLNKDTKDKFKIACFLNETSMTDELIRYIKEYNLKNEKKIDQWNKVKNHKK